MSQEDIGEYRVIAQQNSFESLSAAVKRYAKGNNAGAAEIHNTKEAVTHGFDTAGAFAVAKGDEAKEVATQGVHVVAEKGIEAKHYAAEKTRVAAEAAAQEMAKSEKAEEVKEAAKSMAQKAMDKAQEAREAARDTGEVAMKRAREKAAEAIEVAKRALEYAETKGEGSLKDKDKETLKQAKEYAGQKAILVQEKVGEEQEEGRREHGEPKQAEVSTIDSVGILKVIGVAVIEIAMSTPDMIIGLDPLDPCGSNAVKNHHLLQQEYDGPPGKTQR